MEKLSRFKIDKPEIENSCGDTVEEIIIFENLKSIKKLLKEVLETEQRAHRAGTHHYNTN